MIPLLPKVPMLDDTQAITTFTDTTDGPCASIPSAASRWLKHRDELLWRLVALALATGGTVDDRLGRLPDAIQRRRTTLTHLASLQPPHLLRGELVRRAADRVLAKMLGAGGAHQHEAVERLRGDVLERDLREGESLLLCELLRPLAPQEVVLDAVCSGQLQLPPLCRTLPRRPQLCGHARIGLDLLLHLLRARAIGAIPLAGHESLGEHLPAEDSHVLGQVDGTRCRGVVLCLGPDRPRRLREAHLGGVADGPRFADTLGVGDGRLQPRQPPVAHAPCRVAALKLQLMHHVDDVRDRLRRIVAVEQVQVDVGDAHRLQRLRQVPRNARGLQVCGPELVLPMAAPLGDEDHVITLNLAFPQPVTQ
mmetsp:Transcript_48193/g.108542  ORF Transcript_48193/g.108542 Transcript_48193/m.108542 type:complete len:365 (-) Transcript_48193:308-1402(-)